MQAQRAVNNAEQNRRAYRVRATIKSRNTIAASRVIEDLAERTQLDDAKIKILTEEQILAEEEHALLRQQYTEMRNNAISETTDYMTLLFVGKTFNTEEHFLQAYRAEAVGFLNSIKIIKPSTQKTIVQTSLTNYLQNPNSIEQLYFNLTKQFRKIKKSFFKKFLLKFNIGNPSPAVTIMQKPTFLKTQLTKPGKAMETIQQMLYNNNVAGVSDPTDPVDLIDTTLISDPEMETCLLDPQTATTKPQPAEVLNTQR